MTENQLLRSQRNEIFVAIQRAGLDPAAFEWQRWKSVHSSDMRVSSLVHAATGGYFLFDLLNGEHWCRYSPGREKSMEEDYPGSWPMQMDYVRQWLANLVRESGTADLWETLSLERGLGSAASAASVEENTPLARDEQNRIATGLQEIRGYLASAVTGNTEILKSIDERLEYLDEAATRLGRKDWLNVAFSVVANIAVGAALAPDAARKLLHLAGTLLSWVGGSTPILPSSLH